MAYCEMCQELSLKRAHDQLGCKHVSLILNDNSCLLCLPYLQYITFQWKLLVKQFYEFNLQRISVHCAPVKRDLVIREASFIE